MDARAHAGSNPARVKILLRLLLEICPHGLVSYVVGRWWFHRTVAPRKREAVYTAFANKYDANLDEMEGELTDFPSKADFFQRALKPGVRPIAETELVWPCDGRFVTSGAIADGRVRQVKGLDYTVADLLRNQELAERLRDGSQTTIYLAPGDYHRVHNPFDAEIVACREIGGRAFPVREATQRSIPRLFARNSRVSLECRLPDGRAAAVVMIAAMCVRDITMVRRSGTMEKGAELGRFGFGSTVVAIVEAGGAAFREGAPGELVRVGGAAT